MGDAKRRQVLGLPPRTVRLPALEEAEVQLIHKLFHDRLHQLQHIGHDQLNESDHAELHALEHLHHKVFGH